jgi:hypothetical protein
MLTDQQVPRENRLPEIVIVERRDEYPAVVVRNFAGTNRDYLWRRHLSADLDRCLTPRGRSLLRMGDDRRRGDGHKGHREKCHSLHH